MALIPTAAERASLHFSVGSLGFGWRYLVAAVLFLLGGTIWLYTPLSYLGLLVVVAGHIPLWVTKQRLAPGGATPAHEQVWAPVEDDWYGRVNQLEQAGASWDLSPYDISSRFGCFTFVVGAILVVIASQLTRMVWGSAFALRFVILAVFLFVPLWLNGMRSIWHPSELRKKGLALATARKVAEELAGDRYECIPLLALREGKKGKYPVDARMMLRPKESGEGLFLGIQVQVALNNVRGVDFPYLYCVVLVKEKGRLPTVVRRKPKLVYEPGKDAGVEFLVVRQHADRKGGWHTDDGAVEKIVAESVNLAEQCLQDGK
ncbi:MAG: hypothetical protein JW797_12355 [Bradymonadales bacterium]|nr:hypothetical protein [Bradymonadales bacterium]